MLKRIVTLLKNGRAVKTALSTLSYLYDGHNSSLDALGGLTQAELAAVCRWAQEANGLVVEVGTLFGLTARAMQESAPQSRIVAIDNFCWNPFGLPSAIHEQFTRRILVGSGVELVRVSSETWRHELTEMPAMIFFDADHRYESVKEELLWAKANGIPFICGHDYDNPNPRFGVTRAVDEVFGRNRVEVVGMCWRVKV